MTEDEVKRLRELADRGWHRAELYMRGDGQMAMTTPTGHPLAPLVARLLAEREKLLEALRAAISETDAKPRLAPDLDLVDEVSLRRCRIAVAFAEEASGEQK